MLLLILIGGTAIWGIVSLFTWKPQAEMQQGLRLLGILLFFVVVLVAFGIGNCAVSLS